MRPAVEILALNLCDLCDGDFVYPHVVVVAGGILSVCDSCYDKMCEEEPQ